MKNFLRLWAECYRDTLADAEFWFELSLIGGVVFGGALALAAVNSLVW